MKYGNKKVTIDGFNFDSKGEGNRYCELKLLLRANAISDLELQSTIELQPKFKAQGKAERAINYIADFVYTENGKTIIEDFKGFATKDYLLKRKMLLYMISKGEFIGEFREIRTR